MGKEGEEGEERQWASETQKVKTQIQGANQNMINKVGGARHFGKPSNMPEAENKTFKLLYYYLYFL